MTESTPQPVEAPTCYRHPDQVAHVRCSRCERPICPACMISAPVGFQCPECVGTTQVRQPTTLTGAALITKPVVTRTLIGINLAVFVLQLISGINTLAGDFGMWPIGVAVGGEWWRLLTAAFLHGSLLHIAFNMYVLFAIGQTLERVLGHVGYLVLYLVAALGGSVASYAFSDIQTVSVGASGAIFGLMGALVIAGRRLRYDISQVLVLLGVNILIGFVAPGIDWRAHLGGLVVGAAVAAIFVHTPRANRRLWQVLGVLGVLAILVGITAWRTSEIMALIGPLVGLVST